MTQYLHVHVNPFAIEFLSGTCILQQPIDEMLEVTSVVSVDLIP